MTSRRAAAITALVCLTTIVSHSFGRSLYGLLLSAIEDDLGLSHAQGGLPSSGIFVLYVIGVLGVVWFSPRVEPITIMRVAIAAAAVGMLIAATAPGLVALIIGVSLTGGAGAGIWMTAPVLATAYVSDRRRGLVIGALTSTIGLANVTMGFGTTALRRSTGNDVLWRPIWWIALGFTVLLLVALIGVARFERTEKVSTTGISLSILRQVPRWKQLTIAYMLFGGMSAGFGSFIVAALEEHGGLTRNASSVTFSLMGVASMVVAPLAGALSDRVGRPVVMKTALCVLISANVLVAIGGFWPAIAGSLLYGAGSASFPALIATAVRDSLDNRSFSQALAMMTIMFSVMAALLPTFVGLIADATNSFRWPYLVNAALPALAFIVFSAGSADRHSHKVAVE